MMKPTLITRVRQTILALPLMLLGSSLVAQTPLVQNPSFESNFNPTWPHYSGVDEWSGGSGINDRSLDSGGPFHDNGLTPDRDRVAFIQNVGSLSQTIFGLTPGQTYWIQFFYNCRMPGPLDLKVSFGGELLDTIRNVQPVGETKPFHFRNVPFTAASDYGLLSFSIVPYGDQSALFDAVTIVARDEDDLVVINPSFEASGYQPNTGVLTKLAGWTGTGEFGVDMGFGFYADNGDIPDQALVAFIQGEGSLEQTISGLIIGQSYTVSFAYNAKLNETPHLRVQAGATVLLDTDVTAVGYGAAFHTATAQFTATAEQVVLSFAQTKATADTVLLDNVRVRGQAAVSFPPITLSPTEALLAPGQTVNVEVSLPSEALVLRAREVVLHADPEVAAITGADEDGEITLYFEQMPPGPAAPVVQTVEVTGVKRGTTQVEVKDGDELEVANVTRIAVTESFVRNPSFESGPAVTGVGYGSILAWNRTGNGGRNSLGMPFAGDGSNGPIPDRELVAFIQREGTMSQTIYGLTPGQSYWLQFRYNVRDYVPEGQSGPPLLDLVVRFGGETLANITGIQPAKEAGLTGYYFTNLVFTPTAASGNLEFSAVPVTGDVSLLLDAVSIVARGAADVVLENPSFEASGTPAGVGYITPQLVAGWHTSAGGYGVNIDGEGPFANNGAAPDQDLVLFLQNGGSYVSQTVSDLVIGEKYTLIFALNARRIGDNFPLIRVSFDGEILLEEEVRPVDDLEGSNPYHTKHLVFTAGNTEGDLWFENASDPEADATLLLDNVRLVAGEARPPAQLRIALLPENIVRLSWDAADTGYTLETTGTLPGNWEAITAQPVIENGEWVVLLSQESGQQFFRLKQ